MKRVMMALGCAAVTMFAGCMCDQMAARVKFTSAPRIGIAYASKRDQDRKWRFTLRPEGRSLARRVF